MNAIDKVLYATSELTTRKGWSIGSTAVVAVACIALLLAVHAVRGVLGQVDSELDREMPRRVTMEFRAIGIGLEFSDERIAELREWDEIEHIDPMLEMGMGVELSGHQSDLVIGQSVKPNDPLCFPDRLEWGSGVSADDAPEIVVPGSLLRSLGGTLSPQGPTPSTLWVDVSRTREGETEHHVQEMSIVGVMRSESGNRAYLPYDVMAELDTWCAGYREDLDDAQLTYDHAIVYVRPDRLTLLDVDVAQLGVEAEETGRVTTLQQAGWVRLDRPMDAGVQGGSDRFDVWVAEVEAEGKKLSAVALDDHDPRWSLVPEALRPNVGEATLLDHGADASTSLRVGRDRLRVLGNVDNASLGADLLIHGDTVAHLSVESQGAPAREPRGLQGPPIDVDRDRGRPDALSRAGDARGGRSRGRRRSASMDTVDTSALLERAHRVDLQVREPAAWSGVFENARAAGADPVALSTPEELELIRFRVTDPMASEGRVSEALVDLLRQARASIYRVVPHRVTTVLVGGEPLPLTGTTTNDPERFGAGLLAGRWIASDREVVLSAARAALLFAGAAPTECVGKTVTAFGDSPSGARAAAGLDLRVVGVAANLSYADCNLLEELDRWATGELGLDPASGRLLSRADLLRADGALSAVAYARSLADLKQLIVRLEESGYVVKHRLEDVEAVERMADRSWTISGLLIGSLVGASLLLSWCASSMHVRSRRREIGILCALGTPQRVVLQMLAIQGALLGVLAFVVASVIAIFAAPTFGAALESIAGHASGAPRSIASSEWPLFVVAFAVCVASPVLGALLGGWRIARQPVLNSLRCAD